jgi:hypothetical protein
MKFEIDEAAAEVVRTTYKLYNDGLGYFKIAKHLSDLHIPTPNMHIKFRKEANGEECDLKAKDKWNVATLSKILTNDFYIGTLRQGKYKRKGINGADVRVDEAEHLVFENNHPPIIEYRTFAITQEQLKLRAKVGYRGVKKYNNTYSGLIYCGDCGSPMFALSRSDLAQAYTCGAYHRHGRKGCTSHHTRADLLDKLVKSYVKTVRDNSSAMLDKLNKDLENTPGIMEVNAITIETLQNQIDLAKEEMKALARQQAKETQRNPEKEAVIDAMYNEMTDEVMNRIDGLTYQMNMMSDRNNTIARASRMTKTALDVFNDILGKEKLDKTACT